MRSGIWLLGCLGALLSLAAEPERALYREDFEGPMEGQPLAHWATSGGRWVLSREGNGVLRQTQPNERGQASAVRSWADYTVTAALRCEAHEPIWGMGLIAHWQDEAHHYRLIYGPRVLSLLKVQEREINRLAVAPAILTEKKWYLFALRTVHQGTGVLLQGKVWPQGAAEPEEWKLTATDARGAFTHGPGGFWTGNAAVRFDHYKVTLSPASGTPAENGFGEDFEGAFRGALPPGWWTLGGEWEVVPAETQTLQQSQASLDIDFNGNAYAINRGWADYTVQARMQVTENQGDGGVGLMGYWQDVNRNYRLYTVADTLFLARRSGGGKTVHLQSASLDLRPRVWYVFKLCLENQPGATKLYGKVWPENEREPGDWLLTAEDASPYRYTAGTVGFWTLRAAGSFDNLVVIPNR